MNKLMQVILIALLPLTSMGALTVNNGGGATNITATSAWITATVASTGAANPNLFSHWGTNSGGTNTTAWDHTNAYGVCTQGSYSVQITGLSGSTIYYFRTRATNSSESAWASYTAQFITLTTPTSAPPSSVRAVTVDTNAVLKDPANFFVVNSNLVKIAIGYTTEVDPVWTGVSNTVVYTNDSRLTDSRSWLERDYSLITNPPAILSTNDLASTNWVIAQGYITGYTETDSIATNLIAISSNHFEAVKLNTNDARYLAALTNETYLGTITGATIAAGSADTVTITGPNAAIVWNTNAASGGGTSGDTNAVWGNISGTLADQLDLTSTVAKANGALQSAGDGSQLTGVNATNATALGGITAGNYARTDIENTFLGRMTINSNLTLGPIGYDGTNGAGSINMGIEDGNVATSSMKPMGAGSMNAGRITGGSGGYSGMHASGIGAMNRGHIYLGNGTYMYASGVGAVNLGYLAGAGYVIENNGNGSVALVDNTGSITITNHASIVLGNGTSLEDRSIKCDVVRATTLYGNGAGLTNISGILTTAEKTLATNSVQIGSAASVASLQVTGGSPTNGAVWLCTNTATGAGRWSWPVAFKVTTSINIVNGDEAPLLIPWTTTNFNYGSHFAGTTFTAPVNGVYRFTLTFTVALGGGATAAYVVIKENATILAGTYYGTYAGTGADAIHNVDTGEIYLTNGTPIRAYGGAYDAGTINCNPMRLSGALIRELP